MYGHRLGLVNLPQTSSLFIGEVYQPMLESSKMRLKRNLNYHYATYLTFLGAVCQPGGLANRPQKCTGPMAPYYWTKVQYFTLCKASTFCFEYHFYFL